MRIALSNIAWDRGEDDQVAALLARHGIDAIDTAPGKYFPVPAAASAADIGAVRQWWEQRGIAFTGMQALLFGTTGLNLFGPAAMQEAMLDHLDQVCRIGAGLGASRLVFGSPRNRDCGTLDAAAARNAAVPFFRRLGELAARHGVLVCLEPNPPCYGANFMTDSAHTAQVVAQTGHPAIRMQFDTGAAAINEEDPAAVLEQYGPLIGHVHASDTGLLPLGDGQADHAAMGRAIARYLPGHVVSIEMLATSDESHLASIERALLCARRHYGAGAA